MSTTQNAPPQIHPLLISVPKAAERVGLSPSTVYDLIQSNKFPHKRVGRRLLVPVAALDDWAKSDLQ